MGGRWINDWRATSTPSTRTVSPSTAEIVMPRELNVNACAGRLSAEVRQRAGLRQLSGGPDSVGTKVRAQAFGDLGARQLEFEAIVSKSADECVVPFARSINEYVVARITVQEIIIETTIEAIVARAAVKRIATGPADDVIVAAIPIQDVVTGGAIDKVVAATAKDAIVAVFAEDAVVSSVTCQSIRTGSAEDVVISSATIDPVVAGTALNVIGIRRPNEDIVQISSDNRRHSSLPHDPLRCVKGTQFAFQKG